MPLGLTMHGKWDGISMASPQLHAFKHERPAYSTPQPVENTPANNECRMVELRGAKVASFFVGGDEFVCLPQAFDLFLKHLVGGLHTVYTKLKRLSIAPVVCNVEQVRILRGLGAIQPGVNRCKLITRKDFEILYQDCTQASRPGRPPKRYPMLPPTTDLMSHHVGMRSMSAAHGMLSASDLNNFHKRIRLDQDVEKHLHQQQERRMSSSPTKESSPLSNKELAIPQSSEIHANAANLYLQAQQAIRQQYQQVAASGLHNSLDSQHPAAAAGINPALAPLMMMSHPALFAGGLPPSSMSMLNHINQFAQSHGNMHQQAAAAQAAAQVAAAAQSAAHASLAAAASAHHSSSSRDEERTRNISIQDEKDSDCEEIHTPRSLTSITHVNTAGLSNGIGSDGCASPQSSISSDLGGKQISDGSLSGHSDSADSTKDMGYMNDSSRPGSSGSLQRENNEEVGMEHSTYQDRDVNNNSDSVTTHDDVSGNMANCVSTDVAHAIGGPANISSMQTLLTNIQGLLKVAADNARLQEKHCSFEISDLKTRMTKERQMRGTVEKKLQESERIRNLMQKRLKKERKVRKMLQEQLLTMQRQLGHDNETGLGKIAAAPTIPITGGLSAGRETSGQRSPQNTMPAATASHHQYSPQPESPSCAGASSPSSVADAAGANMAYSKIIASAPSPVSTACVTSPLNVGGSATFLHSRMMAAVTNTNNSSNNSLSPTRDSHNAVLSPNSFTSSRRTSVGDHDINMEMAMAAREHVEHSGMPDARLYFNAGRFQTTASQ